MKTKLTLLIILCLAFSSIAWIGLPPQAAELTETSAAPSYTAKISGFDLILTGKNFNKKHEYKIKVRANEGDPWTKIGAIRPKADGKFNVTVKLPQNLRSEKTLRVCLKDTTTNRLYCVKTRR